MPKHLRTLAALILATLPLSARAEGCHLERSFSIDLIGPPTDTPYIAATVNGAPATFIVDTGGAWSFLASSLADGLPTARLPMELSLYDAADATLNIAVTVKEFAIPGHPPSQMQFIKGEVSTLGANVLRDFDTELDPVERKLNLLKHNRCSTPPVYWPHSELATLPFHWEGADLISVDVKLDGEEMRALIDTGSAMSELDDRAARNRFEITPDSPGTEASHQARAASGALIGEYRHQFKTLELDGLTLSNPWIRIGQHGHSFFNPGQLPPLIIGMSTLAPFHIYIAYADRKIYLTTARGDIAAGRQPAAGGTDPLGQVNGRELLESAENSMRAGDPAAARHALDRAVALAPDDPAPLAARAWFLAGQHDAAGAKADYDRLNSMKLQTAAQYAARSDAYRHAGQLDKALADADAAVRLGPDQATMLNLRCWTRAIMGRLDDALADCNAALTIAPKASRILDSRGFVALKAGRLDAALADYASAISVDPRNASALYGRSLVERRKGDTAAADADLAAAKAIKPDIEQTFGT